MPVSHHHTRGSSSGSSDTRRSPQPRFTTQQSYSPPAPPSSPDSSVDDNSSPDGQQQQHHETDHPSSPFRDISVSDWRATAALLRSNPEQAVLPNYDEINKHTTTILHKALTSKTIDAASRMSICQEVIGVNPSVATVKNYRGSLPLHLAVRNNVKMDHHTKEQVIDMLINAHPQALATGDAFGHTPLHIACDKCCTAKETKILIEACPEAANMRDEKGYLPIHIACSRRCTPDKLTVLLDANPSSIDSVTSDGDTPLALVTMSTTKKNPNTELINILNERLGNRKQQVRIDVTRSNVMPRKTNRAASHPTRSNNHRDAEDSSSKSHMTTTMTSDEDQDDMEESEQERSVKSTKRTRSASTNSNAEDMDTKPGERTTGPSPADLSLRNNNMTTSDEDQDNFDEMEQERTTMAAKRRRSASPNSADDDMDAKGGVSVASSVAAATAAATAGIDPRTLASRRQQQLLFDPRLQFSHLQQVHPQLSRLGHHTGAGLPVAHYGLPIHQDPALLEYEYFLELEAARRAEESLLVRQQNAQVLQEIRERQEWQSLLLEQSKIEKHKLLEEVDALKVMMGMEGDDSSKLKREMEGIQQKITKVEEDHKRQTEELKAQHNDNLAILQRQCQEKWNTAKINHENKLRQITHESQNRIDEISSKSTEITSSYDLDITNANNKITKLDQSAKITQELQKKKLEQREEFYRQEITKAVTTHHEQLVQNRSFYNRRIEQLEDQLSKSREMCLIRERQELENRVTRGLTKMSNKADVAAFHMIMFLKEDIGRLQKVIDSLKEGDLSNVNKVEEMVMGEHNTV